MRITDLEVEGYGVWSGLRIEKFSDALNVLYGPNEAGKTTLLQFVRSMLYGFSPGRRRYLPPVHGGRPGGVLHLASPHGRFEIGRYDNSLPDGTPGEQVTLTAPDGTRQGEHFIKVLLSNVDEPVFNNVFAVGLREIQELATLERHRGRRVALQPLGRIGPRIAGRRVAGAGRTRGTASSTPPASRARWSNCWPNKKSSARRSRNSGRSTAAGAICWPSAISFIRKSRGWRRTSIGPST